MKKYYLFNGDCLVGLKRLKDNSVDSLVTDPPAGIAFMGKDWDGDKGGRKEWIAWMTEVMREALRVLKPGAHGLVWALPRTSHWTATALEDAGFEVRDVVTHIFGSGFPKSLDVSKAIDKAAGAKRAPGVQYVAPDGKARGVDLGIQGGKFSSGGSNYVAEKLVTAPATDDAKKWQGWGTALKPASEHWILVRKPLSEKTVAANVLKWGTGALNIDASRIDPVGFTSGGSCKGNSALPMNKNAGIAEARARSQQHAQGRFPANLTLDEYAASLIDEQSGHLHSRGNKNPSTGNSDKGFIKCGTPSGGEYTRDSGGASRFFYVAKASKRDKGEDNTHPTVKSSALMTYLIRMVTPPGGIVLDPFMGSGSTGVAALQSDFQFLGIEKEKEYFDIAGKRISST